MARTWLSIRVELVSGRGEDFWPRPGRIFAAARSHSFRQLSRAIDRAFARWDLAHLHSFTVADGTSVTPLDLWDGEAPQGSLDSDKTKLSRLQPGEQFAYRFDFGDDWAHLCTVAAERIDPLDAVGVRPYRRRPTSAGATCRTNTGVAGTPTAATLPNPSDRLACWPTFHLCCPGGVHARTTTSSTLGLARLTVNVGEHAPRPSNSASTGAPTNPSR